MARDKRPYISMMLFSVVTSAFGFAALATPHWFVIDTTIAHHRLGLFQTCLANAGTAAVPSLQCSPLSFTPFCGNSYGSLQGRAYATAAMALLGVFANVVTGAAAVAGWWFTPVSPIFLFSTTAFAAITMCIALSIMVDTNDAWYWCGADFCTYFYSTLGGSGYCQATIGMSYVFALIFVALTLAMGGISATFLRGVVSGKIAYKSGHRDDDDDEQRDDHADDGQPLESHEPTAAGGSTNSHRTMNAAPPTQGRSRQWGQSQSAVVRDATAIDTNQLGGDWTLDARTGLFWSATQQLFLDVDRRMFFDPVARQWYDPSSKVWIPAAMDS